jgi:hypothetical protein
MLYYWDDRDGSDFSGWWFGPKVGGDQAGMPWDAVVNFDGQKNMG